MKNKVKKNILPMNVPSTWFLCSNLKRRNLNDKGIDELIRRINFAWEKLGWDWEADFLDIPKAEKSSVSSEEAKK